MKKIRILFAMGGIMRRAGAETVIMRYIRELIKMNKFGISVLVHGDNKGDYDDELATYGIPIYHMPIRGQHIFTYNKALHNFFNAHDFDIVHCNMDTACGDFLETARRHNIKVRIAHSHTTDYQTHNVIKKLHSYLSKKKIPKVATDLFACSNLAGEWMYGNNNFIVVKNAMDLNIYRPSQNTRKEVRNELGITKKNIVIGHVGRFMFQKNHSELLKIFDIFHSSYSNSVLICVGDGEERKNIETLAKSLNIEDNVLFLGVRNDVERIMQAFDVFVLPSLVEGLPLVGIEAQASGLPCLFANTITDEVCLGDKCKMLPLNDLELWRDEIENLIGKQVDYQYNRQQLSANGYDIQIEAQKLARYYLHALGNNTK